MFMKCLALPNSFYVMLLKEDINMFTLQCILSGKVFAQQLSLCQDVAKTCKDEDG